VNVLAVDRLRYAFGSLVVTDDVSLSIAQGERHVVIGPNGAGKTSPTAGASSSKAETSPGLRPTASAGSVWRAPFSATICFII